MKNKKGEEKIKKDVHGFFAEFKKFISRGNIVDMAVGVIIGGAFSTIVTALTNKIIMPFINLLLSLGGENGLEKAYTFLKKVYDVNGEIDLAKSIFIDWGSFITAIINFFIIAFVLFIALKTAMKANEVFKDAMYHATDKEYISERKSVKAFAKQNKIPFKKAWKDHLEQKAQALAEARALEEANKPKVETTDQILKDIRDLLKSQVVQNKTEIEQSQE